MIEGDRDFGYSLECEVCGKTIDNFETFYDAVEYKKENGWKSVKVNGAWEDRCPDCAGYFVTI